MATARFPHVPSINAVEDFGKLQAGDHVTTSKEQQQQVTTTTTTTTTTNCLSFAAGARVLFATDEWFAEASNLLQDTRAPVFDPHAFGLHGKVMDGWESRRRRQPGHDWCLVQLSERVRIVPAQSSSCCCTGSTVVHIDTAYFTGNYAPAVSMVGYDLTRAQAARLVQDIPHAVDRLVQPWTCRQGTCASLAETEHVAQLLQAACGTAIPLLDPTPLSPGYEESRHHVVPITTTADDNDDRCLTHVCISMHPDGGMARLRLEGAIPAPRPADTPESVLPNVQDDYRVPHHHASRSTPDAAVVVVQLPSARLRADPQLVEVSCLPGCCAGGCSDSHYGHPNHLLQSSMGVDMGDGWETARHTNRPRSLVRDPQTGLVDFGGLHDWCILSLSTTTSTTCSSSILHSIVVDTQHFRGNYPESIWIQGRNCDDGDDDDTWHTVVPRSRLGPDAEHLFTISSDSKVTLVPSQLRLTIYPDGGLSRVRVFARRAVQNNE